MDASFHSAIAGVPSGAWAVGVSGGADSVALLAALHARGDLSLHVVHLDHETRGGQSVEDARFVEALAARMNLPVTVALRSAVETPAIRQLANSSARYRAARIELFRQVVASDRLQGVLLAHHRGDQAETILLRLLRGAGPSGLGGMTPETSLGGLRILRPLLNVAPAALREYLVQRKQSWREDESNPLPVYRRNRLRVILHAAELEAKLLALGGASRAWRQWLVDTSPTLGKSFALDQLQDLPAAVARESARRWLQSQGADPNDLSPAAAQRLVAMALDAASPARQHFPGGLCVRRSQGRIALAR